MQCNGWYRKGLSVCPSDIHVHCDKTKETCAHILIPHKRTFILVFRYKEWLMGDDPLYLKFWPNWHRESKKNTDSQFIFARSTSAITPSEKSSINTNRKSTTCFPMNLRWTSYVAHKPSGKTAVFCVKLRFT